MSFLNRILEETRLRVEQEKLAETPVEFDFSPSWTPRGLVRALRGRPWPAIIAEVKRASPSKGAIDLDADPVTIARHYSAGGAAAISVLTEPVHFAGNARFIPAIREHESEALLLRKDFIVDPFQVAQSRALGADALLLIAAALTPSTLCDLLRHSLARGLDVLLEVHDETDAEMAIECMRSVNDHWNVADRVALGINNRNLETLAVDAKTCARLAPLILDKFKTVLGNEAPLLVAESGLRCAKDLAELAKAGFHSFLIGESLMTSSDRGESLRLLIKDAREAHVS
jgi:indole-3-glycerol phosphate synthase